MEKILFLTPYFAAVGISTAIAFYAWRHRDVKGASAYALHVAAQSLWALQYIFELLANDIDAKIYWDSAQWISLVIASITFPVFVAQYTNANIPGLTRLFKLSLAVPVLFVTALFVPAFRPLFYPNPILDHSFIFSELVYDFTWLTITYGGYSELLSLISIGLLIQSLVQPIQLYRKQILAVTLGFLTPITLTLATLFGLEFQPFRDVGPLAFAIGNSIVAWGLFRYKFLDVTPIARDLVFDNIDDLVIVLDTHNRIVDINNTALEALQTKTSKVIGQPVEKVYRGIPQVLERFREPENIHVQIELQRKDGLHHYDVRSTLIQNRDGHFKGRVFVATDITDYIEMQEQLKERVNQRTKELTQSMKRYQAVVENQTEFIVRWKPDRTRVFVNDAYCHYFGLTKEEAMNIDFVTLIYEEDREIFFKKIAKDAIKIEEANQKYVHRVIRADGTIGWNEWVDTPIRDKDGTIIEYQSVGRDITQQILTERALAHSEKKFYKAFNTTPVMMSIEDDKGTFLDINKAFLEALDYKKEQVVGRKASELGFINNTNDLETLQKETQEKGYLKDFEIGIKKKTGELGTILLSNDIFDIDGVHYTVSAGLDITERKEAEQKLIETYDITLKGWAKALELRDKETEGHTRRVTELTVKLAQACGIPDDEIDDIRRGAILHDIGKLAISDQVLLKPGELNREEWQSMSQHPQLGYRLLAPIDFLKGSLDIVLYHHERWDGSGYPKGLKGEAIPLSARIFAIVDVWDAIQSERPYKKAWSREDAITFMSKNAGSHFDPKLIELFLTLVKNKQV